MAKKTKILNANGTEYRSAKRNLDEMTPRERIQAVQELNMAAVQYRKQITEIFMNEIRENALLPEPKEFILKCKCGILNTMTQEYLEKFILRTHRWAQIAENLGYVVNFNKWRDTREYTWFFKPADYEDLDREVLL